MTDLLIKRVDGDAALQDLKDWQHVHNVVVPPFHLPLDAVRERAGRNHMDVAYVGDVLVGCSTVRPPEGDEAVVTVIARVLAEHRRQGFGEQLYARGLERARESGAGVIETLVLESNQDGLRFALKHGFAEVERYVLPGLTIPEIALRLS
ncbi:GNAT family N-acetyltransferase [Streptomyces sporangiiformans]|uniref:GNAT family N-acetyltransferase n=1 Tax=Streptomyces sporangiiformans TaxID=2315329 RepID=UPI001F097EA7|nr:GNAT family N-acetyltransferase [Streptomyces sporangiiformans]